MGSSPPCPLMAPLRAHAPDTQESIACRISRELDKSHDSIYIIPNLYLWDVHAESLGDWIKFTVTVEYVSVCTQVPFTMSVDRLWRDVLAHALHHVMHLVCTNQTFNMSM